MADRSVNVKLKMDVAAYLAGARAASAATRDVDKAARDLRKALNEEEDAAGRVRVAEERLNEARKSGKASASQLAAAEEDLARAHRQHEVATDRVSAANERYIESQKKVVVESKKTTEKVDTDMSRLASRTNAQFDALKFTGLSVGLPAAAAVGVLATTGLVAAAGGLFIGLGVAGAMGAEQVSRSWIDTANVVTHGVTQLSGVYESRLVSASESVSDSFVRSTGLIQRGMLNASGGVDTLVHAGLSLAENALPGIVTASGQLGPVLDGLDSLLGDVGTGFGEMAANASQGSAGARDGLVILGDTLRTVEARVGTISANFANASSGPLNSFRYTLDQVTGALVDASAQGSAVNGFLGGFSTSANGAITVARGLFTALNALPPEVAQLGGAVTSTSMIMNKLGVDGGKGWEGLGAKIKGAGKELQGTEKFAAKAGTAVGGLAAGALNPAALAVGALSIGLLVLGDRQEKAAAAAAEHRENVRTLTDAIRQDNGAVSEAAATANVHALAQKNAADNLNVAGIALSTATVAANGNEKAMRDVTQASNGWIQGLADSGIIAQKSANSLKGINQGLLENGGSWDTASGAAYGFTESMASMHPEQLKQLQALLNGTGAIGEQAKATREAYQAYLLSEQGLTNLTEAQIRARDATIEHTKAIYDQQNANLGYRGAVQSSKEALDAYNKVVKDGKLNTDEGTRATLALENAFSQQEQAAYQAAYANSTAKTEQEKVKEATAALNRETINLANSFAGPLPLSLSQAIGKMSVTEARAAGLTVGIDGTGAAVYRLPNGKEIKLTGDNGNALAAVRTVQNELNALRDKKVTLTMNTTYTYSGTARGPNAASPTASARFSAAGNLFMPGDGAAQPAAFFANGGLPGWEMPGNLATMVPPNTLRYVGDNMNVPELFAPLNGSDRSRELIIKAAEHEGILGPRLAMANGGMVQAEDGTWVPESFYGPAPKGPHAMLTEEGYAKLRAQASANGIGSLAPILQDQLRTYGGWKDVSPVSMAIQSGAAVQSVPSSASGHMGYTFQFGRGTGQLEQALIAWLKDTIRKRGGDVQKALT